MSAKSKARKNSNESAPKFEQLAAEPQIGLIREFGEFLLTNKKWWLTPIVVVMLLIGLLVMLNNTPLAPFIYTLF